MRECIRELVGQYSDRNGILCNYSSESNTTPLTVSLKHLPFFLANHYMEADGSSRSFWIPDPHLSVPTCESITVGRKTSPCELPFHTSAHSSQHHAEPGNFRGFSCHVLLHGALDFQPEASNISPYAKDRAKQISLIPLLNFTENILWSAKQLRKRSQQPTS